MNLFALVTTHPRMSMEALLSIKFMPSKELTERHSLHVNQGRPVLGFDNCCVLVGGQHCNVSYSTDLLSKEQFYSLMLWRWWSYWIREGGLTAKRRSLITCWHTAGLVPFWPPTCTWLLLRNTLLRHVLLPMQGNFHVCTLSAHIPVVLHGHEIVWMFALVPFLMKVTHGNSWNVWVWTRHAVCCRLYVLDSSYLTILHAPLFLFLFPKQL